MNPSRLLGFAAAVLALAGCGSSDSDRGGPSAAESSPTATPAGVTVITTHGEVDAGTYRIEVAEPPMEFTLEGDGWFIGEPQAGFNGFNLYPSDPNAYVLIFRPDSVYDDGDFNPDPMPKNLARWLRKRKALTVEPPTRVELDGHPATRFDATVTGADTPCDAGDGKKSRCIFLAPIDANEPFRFVAGERIRFWVLDLDGPVLISVSHFGERFDGFVDRGTAVVESIRFLDGQT